MPCVLRLQLSGLAKDADNRSHFLQLVLLGSIALSIHMKPFNPIEADLFDRRLLWLNLVPLASLLSL